MLLALLVGLVVVEGFALLVAAAAAEVFVFRSYNCCLSRSNRAFNSSFSRCKPTTSTLVVVVVVAGVAVVVVEAADVAAAAVAKEVAKLVFVLVWLWLVLVVLVVAAAGPK